MVDSLARLTDIRSTDPDLQRRGRILLVVSVAMTVLALLFIPVALIRGSLLTALPVLLIGAVFFIIAALLGRSGHVVAGAYLLIGVTLLAILGSLLFGTTTSNTPFYLVLPVLMAGVLLPPVQIWSMAVLSIIGFAVSVGMLPAEVRADPTWMQTTRGVPLLLLITALLTFLSARSMSQALGEAREARAIAETASQELATANASLEARVSERTAEMQQLLAVQQAASAELAASLQAQRELNELVAALSMPVIPVTDETLVVPLVGNLDAERAELLIAAVLERITDSRARTVILDVTGVPIVDTQVAATLLRVASATRLLGAESMLCGIRPEVAQTLVNLGADLSALRTAATLQDGLAQTLVSAR